VLSTIKFPAAVLAALLSTLATAAALTVTPREQAIIDRIKPVGNICVEGKGCSDDPVAAESASPAQATPSTADSPVASAPAAAAALAVAAPARSGEAVYNASCIACHSTGVAGAPKLGVAADWAPRIAQGESMLMEHAMKGLRGMPPMGTCMNCTAEEIKLAVEHMLP
jgi:cytochrome c5